MLINHDENELYIAAARGIPSDIVSSVRIKSARYYR